MGNLVTGYVVSPSHIRVWADIPRRRNGEHNEAAMARALLKLSEINPDTFDPPEPAKPEPIRFEGVVIDESAARVLMRDGVVVSSDDPIGPPACRNGSCDE